MKLRMCIAYEVDGKKMDYLPASVDDQLKAKPIYKNFKGMELFNQRYKKI